MATAEIGLDSVRRELLKGSTQTLILSVLANEAMYGYQLAREMAERSSGYFNFKEGTLYPALHRLERDQLVEAKWEESPNGQFRCYYHVTAVGRRRLLSMLREWELFTKAVDRIAQPVMAITNGVLAGLR